ncbi:MAG: PaaX family transcriptional regulator [Candidatus Dormibacterales bacterium]
MRPRRLLVTLLGDYWRGHREPIPSAALVEVLGEFGVSAQSARSTLSRLTQDGLLRRRKAGRRTYYHLTARAQRAFDAGATRIFGFGAETPTWDGAWSMVAFSIAERNRPLRHVLRARLRWLGYAPLYDGFWISPHDRGAESLELLRDLKVDSATVIRGQVVGERNGASPLRAWDLEKLGHRYSSFIARFDPVMGLVTSEGLSPSRALVLRTEVMDAWRSFPREDPDLPTAFLPPRWPRARARALFASTYEALAPLAESYFGEMVEKHR